MAGWIGLYLEEADAALLLDRLNEDPEIAFLMSEGTDRWRAMWRIDDLLGKTMLWHVPGGALPRLKPNGTHALIKDPFSGWQELSPGLDSFVPYFGSGWPSTLLMDLYVRQWRGLLRPDILPLSGITWYGALPVASAKPHASTRRWWNRFRGWLRRHAVQITRSGPLDGPRADVYALPAALRSIQGGMERDPYPLVRLSPPHPSKRIIVKPPPPETT
jgi:hypothetical protein